MGLPTDQDYHLYNLLFADDQVIIAQDTADAAYVLRKLVEEEYMKWRLQIHFGKTEYLTLDLGTEIMTETEQIKTVNKFKLERESTTTLEIAEKEEKEEE
jgi:hypothetical protein